MTTAKNGLAAKSGSNLAEGREFDRGERERLGRPSPELPGIWGSDRIMVSGTMNGTGKEELGMVGWAEWKSSAQRITGRGGGRPRPGRLWHCLDPLRPLRQGDGAATLRFRGGVEVPGWGVTAE